jgi:hypothetical protein
MSNLSLNQKFYILMNEDGMLADIDPCCDGFRWENPGWNLKYYFWFTAEEVDSVIEFLEQNGRSIRPILVPSALVKKFTDFSALL